VEIYRDLQTFFKKKRNTDAEPAAKELEKDLHSLIKGT
jgi:hypothetical protein